MVSNTAVAAATRPIGARALSRAYYQLTKPGIVYSNVMTAGAGYLFASKWHVYAPAAFALLAGTGLIIAASCVTNNYIDRHIDAKMQRTRSRALASGQIAGSAALAYAAALGGLGFVLLGMTNWLTVWVGVAAVASYVALYGIAKRRSVHGTLVGTLPGAAALVAGYTTVQNRLDVATLLLFIVMVCWQMAHFYSIATFRRADYAAAGLPVRPVKKGIQNTKIHITAYIIAFAVATVLLTTFGYEGYVFAVAMIAVSALWLRRALAGFTAPDATVWARGTFLFSLVVLLVFSVAVSVGVLLP